MMSPSFFGGEDDIISIGKFRRPGQPGAHVTYDPSYGIRVEGEIVPPDPVAAGKWCQDQKGWMRVQNKHAARNSFAIKTFLKAWRKK